MGDLPDNLNLTLMKGQDADGNLITVAVDSSGNIVAVMKGAYAGSLITIAVDENGNINSIMKGAYDSTLQTIATDASGRMLARLMGRSGDTMIDVAVDDGGRLSIQEISQSNVTKDESEAQTWTTPIANLLSNMNRIRNQIVGITGEAWGTISHSIATIWGKFHATTGHTHTGASDDAPVLDHGLLSGLGDDDHPQYVHDTGDENIAGIKTFSSIPVLPASDPTTANQASRKDYVDKFLPLGGGVLTGGITLPNNTPLSGKDSGGVARGLISKLPGDQVALNSAGHGSIYAYLPSGGVFRIYSSALADLLSVLETGVATFSSIPAGPASDPTTDNQLARKAYVDGFGRVAYGSYSGDSTADRQIAHGLGRKPYYVMIICIALDTGAYFWEMPMSASRIYYQLGSAVGYYALAVATPTYFCVGDAASYAQSANLTLSTYMWVAMA